MNSALAVAARNQQRSFLLRHSVALAATAALLLCFAGIFQHGLWSPDEPREAEIAREMLLSHWSALPTLAGQPFLEKPPLFVWIVAVAYDWFGVSAGVARIPSALFSIGAALVAYALGRRAAGRIAGVLSALVLLTLVKFADISHCAVNDTALTFFVAAGHFALLVARDRARARARSFAFVLAGICTGLAFLTKGVIGPVLLTAPPLLASVAMREWSYLRHALPRLALWSTVFIVAFGLPWVLALAHTGGWSDVRVCLVDGTLGRSLGSHALGNGFEGHRHGPLYYLSAFPPAALPWILAVPALAAGGTLELGWRGGRARYLAWTVLAGLLLLSIPGTKRELYALPLFPAAAAVFGVWLSRVGSRSGGRWDRATVLTIVGVMALVLLVIGVAGAVVYSASIGRIESVTRVLREQRGGWLVVIALASCAAGAAIAWLAWRTRGNHSKLVRVASLATLLAFLFAHTALLPMVDPLKDMRGGALEIARTVPADHEILGLQCDETTLAVVAFYTERIVHNVPDARDALTALEAGQADYMLVIDEKHLQLADDLRLNLHLAAKIVIDATRTVNVYRYQKPA